jgi:glucosamine--fructose-6-phosphate aminotransferase (isomerizing)
MCGIVGYIGNAECSDILLDGLAKLEYRGYDSAGLAVLSAGRLSIVRAEGKLKNLADALKRTPLSGSLGIGHTRWATHGRPSEQNAHPHKSGPIVVVHNGIVENHLTLAAELKKDGRQFSSETDTEIISHLIAREVENGRGLEEAVRTALMRIKGSYAIAVACETEPDKLIAARQFSPLVIGLGQGETFIASDVPAILSHTREMLFLNDGEIAVVTREGARLVLLDGTPVSREAKHIDWSPSMAEKGGFKHFMLKEIHEQPRALADTLRGRISLERGDVVFPDLPFDRDFLAGLRRIVLIACGTSWHAALVGKFWLEMHTKIPVEVDLASEFRYRSPILDARNLVIVISQSGETADTLAAVSDARAQGATVLAICNAVESSIPRACNATLYTHAGPEISVASTKAFSTQLAVLYLFSIWAARTLQVMDARTAAHKLLELIRIPVLIEEILRGDTVIRDIAERFHRVRDFLYIGRWINYPIALEGALKLKEISYIHAEGYPAGEMKHGPIALIDENMPVVTIVTQNRVYDKIISNMQEAQARRATIIAIASDGDTEIDQHADAIIRVPQIDDELEPLLTVVPTQLLAYYIADFNGTDVDQPRNLAKSVTVE